MALDKGLSKVSSGGFGGGKGASYDAVKKSRVEGLAKMADKANLTDDEKEVMDAWLKDETGKVKLPRIMKGREAQMNALKAQYTHSGLQKEGHESDRDRIQREKKIKAEQINTARQELNNINNTGTEAEKMIAAAKVTALSKEIEQLDNELAEAKLGIETADKTIESVTKSAQNDPKERTLERLRRSGRIGRDAARSATKTKDKSDDILSMLKEMKDKA
jgi:hypothetical protein